MYFECLPAYRGWDGNCLQGVGSDAFFWIESCCLLIWNYRTLTQKLSKKQTFFECDVTFFTEVIIHQHFQLFFSFFFFDRLPTIVLFFLCFSAICEFQCDFCKNTFVLTFIMRILNFGLDVPLVQFIFLYCFTHFCHVLFHCFYFNFYL